jgi:hypothetical protein
VNFASHEDQQSRQKLDFVFSRQVDVLLDLGSDEFRPVAQLAGKLDQDWTHRMTGGAVRSMELHEDQDGRSQDFGVEAIVADFKNSTHFRSSITAEASTGAEIGSK